MCLLTTMREAVNSAQIAFSDFLVGLCEGHPLFQWILSKHSCRIWGALMLSSALALFRQH